MSFHPHLNLIRGNAPFPERPISVALSHANVSNSTCGRLAFSYVVLNLRWNFCVYCLSLAGVHVPGFIQKTPKSEPLHVTCGLWWASSPCTCSFARIVAIA